MILPHNILLSLLTVCASLSPLLTFVRLWQIKEWRFDRLREHLRENGWFRQLFGWVRPLVTALVVLLSGLTIFRETDGVMIGLFLLASLSLIQVLPTNKRPVWTAKARAILALSGGLMFLTTSLVFITDARAVTLILPLFAPIFVILSVLILTPLDAYLKNRILNRAIRLRSAHPRLRVIGITGSVGKTTVKEMLSHLLKKSGALTTPQRVNTEMGVAAWLSSVLSDKPNDATTILIVEMGAYRKGEIALLCTIAQPNYGIITYVGDQHLSLFGSHEAIIEAKGELFAALPPEGRAFGNSDNDAFEALKRRCRCPVTAVGTGQHADIQATDIEETAKGIRFNALGTTFTVPVAGTHNVTGALLAITVAKDMGINVADIARTMQSFRSMSRTFELKTIQGVTVLDDTYNSSPDSVRAAIEWARAQPQTMKILVLEGIIELGDADARIHLELAALAATVFTEAYAAHARHLTYLRDGGFGSRAHPAANRMQKAGKDTLVVLAGRLSPSVMARFI